MSNFTIDRANRNVLHGTFKALDYEMKGTSEERVVQIDKNSTRNCELVVSAILVILMLTGQVRTGIFETRSRISQEALSVELERIEKKGGWEGKESFLECTYS